MNQGSSSRAFTLIEMMVVSAVFGILMVSLMVVLTMTQSKIQSEVGKDAVETTATRIIDALGKDIRESSYSYVFAGDWQARSGPGGAASIVVARNYLSSSPHVGGTMLVPGITNEGWAQCPNPACSWCNRQTTSGMEPVIPNGLLSRPTRNNPIAVAPTFPPTSFSFSDLDGKGRIFGNLPAGDDCPYCRTPLSQEAFFGGFLLFSPRKRDGSFSYGGASGYEAVWESMIFYCPYREPNSASFGLRRYAFHASAFVDGWGNPASLVDLLDLDGNGIIESPPMTDQNGNFVLDADLEQFGLLGTGGRNDLLYLRSNSSTGRSFTIQVNRNSGMASVSVQGGPFSGTRQIPLAVGRFGLGVSNLEVSTFINNPSWSASGATVNSTGVVELGVVRISLQIDKGGAVSRGGLPSIEETVQSTMFRPRN